MDQEQLTLKEFTHHKEWHLHGKCHREDGPAVECHNGNKMWYLHDKCHREDGAAIEWISGGKEWWLHDRRYTTPEPWAEMLLKERNEPHDAMSINAFLKQILKKYAAESL